MAEDIGTLVVRVEANMKNFVTGMNQVASKIETVTNQAEKTLGPAMNKIGDIFKKVGMFAAVGFGAAAVASVKGAAGLEGYRNTLNVVMKDVEKAGEMMAWAVDFANKTPFSTDSVVEATVRLQSYGLEAQKILPTIGDMAGVMNKDVMQAVEAVADAQTGELERLKEFGITKQMIIDQAAKTMMGKQIINNQGQITDQESFNAALLSLMEERFKGGMEIQANSIKGLWSTVTGVAQTTLATMAGITAEGEVVVGGLFDTIKKKIQTVINTLNEWQKNGQLQLWAENVTAAVGSFWAVAEPVFNGLLGAGKWIIDNWGAIGPILAGVLAGFLAYEAAIKIIKAVTLAQEILNLVMSKNPIALVTLAVAGLVAAGVLLYKNWDTIKDKAKEVFGYIKTFIGDVLDGITGSFRVFINATVSAFNTMIRGLNRLKVDIPDWVPKIGGGKLGFNIPEIPKLAMGTNFVPFDTAAFLHKGEAVIPAKNNPANPGAGSPVGRGDVIVNISIGGSVVGRNGMKELRDMISQGISKEFGYSIGGTF